MQRDNINMAKMLFLAQTLQTYNHLLYSEV